MGFLIRAAVELSTDPRRALRAWRGIPRYLLHVARWRRRVRQGPFRMRWRDAWYATYDRYAPAASLPTHYFLQDLWAARWLHRHGVERHVDVGSRVDGFIAQALVFTQVEFIDLRPLDVRVDGLSVRRGSIASLPFADRSVPSLSSLSVVEHIGLGRYGDPLDPDGHRQACAELERVLAPGGTLLVAVPVGAERVCFDAHRVFDPQTVFDLFPQLRLLRFSLIDDRGETVQEEADFALARSCRFGCGLFAFERPATEPG